MRVNVASTVSPRYRPSTRAQAGAHLLATALLSEFRASSKPVRSCNPRLGRFDSCAAPLSRKRLCQAEGGSAWAHRELFRYSAVIGSRRALQHREVERGTGPPRPSRPRSSLRDSRRLLEELQLRATLLRGAIRATAARLRGLAGRRRTIRCKGFRCGRITHYEEGSSAACETPATSSDLGRRPRRRRIRRSRTPPLEDREGKGRRRRTDCRRGRDLRSALPSRSRSPAAARPRSRPRRGGTPRAGRGRRTRRHRRDLDGARAELVERGRPAPERGRRCAESSEVACR
jgi:hypothetical protein